MCHDYHCHVFRRQILDNLQNFARQLRVKRGGRLVKEKNFRLHRQCTRNRNTLLLSARKLTGISVFLVRQSHFFQQLPCLGINFLFFAPADQNRRFGDIFHDGIMGKQIKILEHQTEMLFDALQGFLCGINRLALCVRLCGIVSQINQIAAVHGFQHGCAAQKGGFPRAGRPNDRHNLSFCYRQRNILQHFVFPEAFIAVLNFQYLIHCMPSFLNGNSSVSFQCVPSRMQPHH